MSWEIMRHNLLSRKGTDPSQAPEQSHFSWGNLNVCLTQSKRLCGHLDGEGGGRKVTGDLFLPWAVPRSHLTNSVKGRSQKSLQDDLGCTELSL